MNDENTTALIAPYELGLGGDGIALVATPAATTVRAVFMRFVKGIYVQGMEREPVPLGTCFIVHGASEGWVRLVRDEPVQRIARQPDKPFPRREELGDTDQSKWSLFDGKPSDPWCLTDELLLTEQQTGRPTIFTTTSYTGRDAVGDLCRLITYQRRERGPQAKPIVAIGAGTANFKRGPVAIPKFSIAGWINSAAEPGPSQLKPDLTEHLQERSALSGKETSTTPIPRSRRKKPEPSPWEDDDLADDEIPY